MKIGASKKKPTHRDLELLALKAYQQAAWEGCWVGMFICWAVVMATDHKPFSNGDD